MPIPATRSLKKNPSPVAHRQAKNQPQTPKPVAPPRQQQKRPWPPVDLQVRKNCLSLPSRPAVGAPLAARLLPVACLHQVEFPPARKPGWSSS